MPMPRDEISIDPTDLKKTANNIREYIAAPFAADTTLFYQNLNEFTSKSYVSQASKIKEQQILAKKELLQRMHNVINEYASFLDGTANEFSRRDAENIANFTEM